MLIRKSTMKTFFVFWYWQYHIASAMLFYTPQPQYQQLQLQQQAPSQLPQLQPQTLQPQSQQQLSQAQILIDNNGLVPFTSLINANNSLLVLKILQSDLKNNQALVQFHNVNYTNLHEPRIEVRYQSNNKSFVSIDERTPNNTVVAAVVVNDDDSGPSAETSLAIEHGNELGHFRLVSTQFTNTIQVSGAPLSKQRVPEYNLTIVARDHGSPPKSSAVKLVIKLNTSSTSPSINAPLEPQPSLKPPVTDFMYAGLMLVVIFFTLILILIIGCALVQRPTNKKGPPQRTTSATNSRINPRDSWDHNHHHCFGLAPLDVQIT